MSSAAHEIADAALTLDPADRLALAALLIDSVEQKVDPTWTEAWTEELERRSSSADGRDVRGRPWSEVRAQLLAGLAAK